MGPRDDATQRAVEQTIAGMVQQVRSLLGGMVDLWQDGVEQVVERATGQGASLEGEAAAMHEALSGERIDRLDVGQTPQPLDGPPTTAIRTSVLIGDGAPTSARPDPSSGDKSDTSKAKTVKADKKAKKAAGEKKASNDIQAKKKQAKKKQAKKKQAKKKQAKKKQSSSKTTANRSARRATIERDPSRSGSDAATNPDAPSTKVGASGVAPILTRNPNK